MPWLWQAEPAQLRARIGAAIAVTLNERLDYFGQMVNVAARIQGLADGDEVFVSDEVWAHPGVQELTGRLEVAPQRALLKGIRAEVGVHRLRHRLSAGKAAGA